VLKIVTAFTLAHSITLTLAALGVVTCLRGWSNPRSPPRSCWRP
jgi:VIT1/CCC1 family predicted Fe2+/Mn2+ transporter